MAERVRDLATKLHTSAQVDAIRALAAKFGAEDGAGQALSLVTAAVAVTVTECARRATITPYLEERQLELTSLNILAKASTKLTRAWDAHANRDKNEVNVRDVNIAPGAQAVVGVVGLAATPAAAPPASGSRGGKCTNAILARCSRAFVAGREHARVAAAGRPQCAASSVVVCMEALPDPARR